MVTTATLTVTGTGSGSYRLDWHTSSKVRAYGVQRAPSGGAWTELAEVGPLVRTYTDTPPSAAYSYRIRVRDNRGRTFYSNVVSVGDATAPSPEPAPPPPPPASTNPSGVPMPNADLPGWTLVFNDDFDTPIAIGSWQAAVAQRWQSYVGLNNQSGSYYDPATVVSQHDSMLDYFLHQDAATGHWVTAAAQPILTEDGTTAGKYQTYGRYALAWRADSLQGFYGVPLLWPLSDSYLNDGEIDWPEGNFTSQNMAAFIHKTGAASGAEQTQILSGVPYSSGWHVTVTEWMPGRVNIYLDDVLLGSATDRIPSTAFRWVLQVTGSPQGLPVVGTQGHWQADWVAVWAYNGGTPPPPTTYPDAVLAKSPLAYWRLGESSGVLVNATGVTTYNASTLNTPTYGVTGLIAGDTDKALSFASASLEYAQSNAPLPSIGPAFSLAVWAKPTTVTDATLLSAHSSAYLRVFADGSVSFRWLDAGAVQRTLTSAAGQVTAGATIFLAAVYDGTTARIYKNGVQIASTNSFTGGTIPSDVWSIARHPSAGLYFNGVLDEPAIFNAALSAADIAALYDAGT